MTPRIQILIPAFGEAGIRKVAASRRPRIEGVEYLVSWQLPEGDVPLPDALRRDDFRVKVIRSRGVARNRNSLLSMITAPLALWSDDNDYNSPAQVAAVIRAFEENPDADVLTFRGNHPRLDKYDPAESFDYPHIAKDYYLSTPELAMRSGKVRGRALFNEHFGVGAYFPIGEEEIYVRDLARSGLRWRYLPIAIVDIPGDSTSARIGESESLIRAKGAMHLHFHPMTWPLRLAAHAIRYRSLPGSHGMAWYVRQWMRGVMQAARLRVFKKSNYVVAEKK